MEARPGRLPQEARRGIGLLGLILVVLVCAGAPGCSSTRYLAKRSSDEAPWMRLLPFDAPDPTERTAKLLRQYEVDKVRLDNRLETLQAEIAREPTPEKVFAAAEVAYVAGQKAEHEGALPRAVDLYGASVAHAYWYLFDPEYDVIRNPYDPQFRGACDLYNAALERALRIAKKQGKLQPGKSYRVDTGHQQFVIEVTCRGKWHAEEFERFEFVSDYDITGLANRHHTYGMGVPLIAVRRSHADMEPAESYYPPGLSFAATAFLRVESSLATCRKTGGTHRCVLELYDPLQERDIVVAGRQVPLETDLTTPLAYFLDNPQFEQRKNAATLALLTPDLAKSLQGLFMVEPYNPQRIPVIMIHGLWSSPVTWMDMFNDLRSFPEIRDQYQFWFYLYPTGQPFWISARQLREDLQKMRQVLDPQKQVPALDQLVLVGHSMGGLVAKLQTVDSGEDYWKLLSDRPFTELKADAETKETLAATVYFQPNPSVRRVVTIGTPHRGSEVANDYTRWLGRLFITLPEMMLRATQGLTHNNPGFFKNTELLTMSTSVDSLAPDSPVLQQLIQSPRAPWTKYHNIVGLVEEDHGLFSTLAAGSDGIVGFSSAHLDNISSEITVPSDHVNVHRHPRSILEVRRILLEHRDQVLAELGSDRGAIPATYGEPVSTSN